MWLILLRMFPLSFFKTQPNFDWLPLSQASCSPSNRAFVNIILCVSPLLSVVHKGPPCTAQGLCKREIKLIDMGILSFSCFAAVGKVEPMRAAAEVERREDSTTLNHKQQVKERQENIGKESKQRKQSSSRAAGLVVPHFPFHSRPGLLWFVSPAQYTASEMMQLMNFSLKNAESGVKSFPFLSLLFI